MRQRHYLHRFLKQLHIFSNLYLKIVKYCFYNNCYFINPNMHRINISNNYMKNMNFLFN